jgi:EmrB/QacA subfamily drug resistance transporter
MSNVSNIHWSNINKKTRASIMIALSLGMLMACLDGTVMSTAIKAILEDFEGYDLYSWVFTGFMLCETIMIPLAGKLSDQYGRKPIFMFGLAIFLAGSILSGLSQNMEQLIAFRAIQGIGGGTLIPVATATVADLYAPSERGKMQGMLGALFAVAMAIGPFVGGFNTDHISWHWVFFVNVPIGILAIIFSLRKFPTPDIQDKVKVDYFGMAFLSAFILVLLLFFTWVGVKFDWVSVESLIMGVAAAVLLAVFIKLEFRAPEPVLKPKLFRNKMFIYCCITMFVFGVAMMGVMTYMPVFMQSVIGISATNSGVILLPLVAGMMITSMASGFSVRRTGYRPWLMIGPIIAAAGLILLSTLGIGPGQDDNQIHAVLYLFIVGVGFGCVMSTVMIAAQNSSKVGEMGMTTSSVNLFRSIGSTVAVGIFTTIINGKIASELLNKLPSNIYDILPDHSTGVMNYIGYPPFDAFADLIKQAYGNSVTFAFLIGSFVVLVVLITAIFMKGKPSDAEELQLPESLTAADAAEIAETE